MGRKIHCLFEQSGTFKNAIKKLGGVQQIMTYSTITERQTRFAIYLMK